MTVTAILSALAEEQQGFVDLLEDARCVRRAGREFWIGRLHGQDVVLALSRYGKVAASTTATPLIESFGVDRIVAASVPGSRWVMWSWRTAMYSMTWTPRPCFPDLKSLFTAKRALTAILN